MENKSLSKIIEELNVGLTGEISKVLRLYDTIEDLDIQINDMMNFIIPQLCKIEDREKPFKADWDDLRELCIKNNWFTCGTCQQYDKLYEMTRSGDFTMHEVATVIWVCSDNVEIKEIESQIMWL